MPPRENAVQKACMDILRIAGVFAWRNNTGVARLPGAGGKTRPVFYGAVGSPDILGIIHPGGRLLGVECKSESGRQTREQADWQVRCEASGGVYLLVRSGADLLEQLREKGVVS